MKPAGGAVTQALIQRFWDLGNQNQQPSRYPRRRTRPQGPLNDRLPSQFQQRNCIILVSTKSSRSYGLNTYYESMVCHDERKTEAGTSPVCALAF